MKYILLDTNIILDMVIDRRHQVTDTLLANFIKLLEFDEIKLVVPEIVKIETYRHLDEELSLVGTQIRKTMNSIKGLYGITSYTIAGLDIKEYKNKSNAELAKAYDMYQQNEANYKVALTDTINLLFNHRNSIIIPFDEFLGNAVTKRRIYKKAPFHRVEKESYGDGLITETLINLGRYISLTSDDSIYFVTGNYTDFCVGKDAKTTASKSSSVIGLPINNSPRTIRKKVSQSSPPFYPITKQYYRTPYFCFFSPHPILGHSKKRLDDAYGNSAYSFSTLHIFQALYSSIPLY